MADKSNFTAEEWQKILGSTMLAGLVVTTAAPSGILGMMREGVASSGAVLEAGRDPAASPLMKAVAADFTTSEGRSAAHADIKAVLAGVTTPALAEEKALAGLKEAVALIEAKAPEDAPAFKAWLSTIAERTANAAAEGGFLGFGGVTVSEEEKAALADIAKVLNPQVA